MKYNKVDYKHIPLYAGVSEQQWNDWRWQFRNAVRDIDSLAGIIELDEKEKAEIGECLSRFRMAITPYYAALMDRSYRNCSIRLQAVPSAGELEADLSDMDDPLHEDVDSPAPGLTHRYPDRVLFLVTKVCSMYCRFCTRRRTVGDTDSHLSPEEIEQSIEYIRSRSEIRDVLLIGGDPLTMNTAALEKIIRKLRDIEHVEIIRIGSRTPVVMPMRITDELVSMLKKYQPVYINTHFNHYDEITADSAAACARLADAGIPLGNQTVLLREVNDCPRIIKKLVQKLLTIRVKPYYLYQCDLTSGISHFRTSIAKGTEIIENLQGHTTGLAVPTFVVDAPGGGGKIPLMPNHMVAQSDRRYVLRNYEGVLTEYTQPQNIFSECHCELCRAGEFGPQDGVASLLNGSKLVLEPEDLSRRRRNGSR